MSIADKLNRAVARVSEAVEEFSPVAVFALFSGGNDSLAATYASSRSPMFTAAVHINTGIGVEATREFVRSTCSLRGWPLREYKAMECTFSDGTPNPQNYESICLENGFPGPGAHRFMYVKLKDRQLAQLERDVKATPSRPVLYITGARSEESVRRMGTVVPVRKEGRRVWLNVIHDWSAQDCKELRDHPHIALKPNIVCERIGMSGECLCGAFRKEGELEILRGWPETHAAYLRIIDLQKRVRAAGFPWGWGDEAPSWWKDEKAGQGLLLKPDEETGMELCHNCAKYNGGRA